MKFVPLFIALVTPAFAEAKPKDVLPVPETEKALKVWLEGTKWYTDDQTRQDCFFRGNNFVTPLAKPTFKVKSHRALLVDWGNGVKVTCILSSDCQTMTEIDGLKVVYKFDGRKAPEERSSKLPPKVEKSN